MATHLDHVAEEAVRKEWSYREFFERLLQAEHRERQERSRVQLTKTAGFPAIKTLEQYDFGFATGAPKSMINELTSLAFIERAENVVLLGPSGVGKTHLAIAIGGPWVILAVNTLSPWLPVAAAGDKLIFFRRLALASIVYSGSPL